MFHSKTTMGSISSKTQEERVQQRNALLQIITTYFVRGIVDDVFDKCVDDNIPYMFKMYHLLLYIGSCSQKFYDEKHVIQRHWDCYCVNYEPCAHANYDIGTGSYSRVDDAFNLIFVGNDNLAKCVNYDKTLENCKSNCECWYELYYENQPKYVEVDINVECYELNKLIKKHALKCIIMHKNKIDANENRIKTIAQQIDEFNSIDVENQILDTTNKIDANNKIIAESTNPHSLYPIVEKNKLLHKNVLSLHAKKERHSTIVLEQETLLAENIKIRHGIEKLQKFIGKLLLEPLDIKEGIVVSINPSNETVICPMEMLDNK